MGSTPRPGPDDLFEAGPFGILRLKRRDGAITPKTVRIMQQELTRRCSQSKRNGEADMIQLFDVNLLIA